MTKASVLVVLTLMLTALQPTRAQVPARAMQYLPIVSAQAKEIAPDIPARYFPALIEHESCISLTHSRCWSPTSRLKSQREEGAGLGQLTRAWRANGTQRFDALEDVRRLDAKGLNDLRWDTVYQRPDLQIRAIVLMSRQSWNRLLPLVADASARLAFTDAAYNGGLGGVLNERRACGLRKNCDPSLWFGHVEKVCLKSTKPLYGNRSACDINRHHVVDVLTKRMPKYERLMS